MLLILSLARFIQRYIINQLHTHNISYHNNALANINPKSIPSRIGEYGGQYVAESLMDCLQELEDGFHKANNDAECWKEYRSYYPYMGRPGHLHLADNLSKHAGGANIWLKREDLNHTGSHKINNALGQVLIAERLGKKEII